MLTNERRVIGRGVKKGTHIRSKAGPAPTLSALTADSTRGGLTSLPSPVRAKHRRCAVISPADWPTTPSRLVQASGCGTGKNLELFEYEDFTGEIYRVRTAFVFVRTIRNQIKT